jgi:phosphopantetheinyl transferase
MTPIEREPPMEATFDLAIARCTVAAGLTFACATVSDRIAPATQSALERLLDDDERTTYGTLDDPSDRRCYAAARGLLRIELSYHLSLTPQDWQYVPRPGHPPGIRTPLGRIDRLRFSLSHTRGLVACTVADSSAGPYGQVGIDVEWIRPMPRMMTLAQRHFARPEVEALRALPAPEQSGRFFALWTLRQAWRKAQLCPHPGPAPIDDKDLVITFDRNGKPVATSARPDLEELIGRWRFWLHPLGDSSGPRDSRNPTDGTHLLALAARQQQPQA